MKRVRPATAALSWLTVAAGGALMLFGWTASAETNPSECVTERTNPADSGSLAVVVDPTGPKYCWWHRPQGYQEYVPVMNRDDGSVHMEQRIHKDVQSALDQFQKDKERLDRKREAAQRKDELKQLQSDAVKQLSKKESEAEDADFARAEISPLGRQLKKIEQAPR